MLLNLLARGNGLSLVVGQRQRTPVVLPGADRTAKVSNAGVCWHYRRIQPDWLDLVAES
jgi:hypothetical protein